ncbi:MAG: RHS repeat-associated core domain-containing protein, partial [Candidatus Binatia bacterium]
DPVRTYTYDSFGRIVDETGTVIDPYTYTAREFDPETGLFYYRARYYDPTIGRFLQEDPIGFVGGPNFYAYVRGNPHGFIDPLGLQPIAGIDDVIRIRPGSIAVGTSIGILDLSWNTDNPSAVTFRATTPQLGAGIGFCRDFRPLLDEEDGVNTDLIAAEGTCKRFAGERSRSMPAEQPLIEKPFTYIVGQRWQGVSFQDNFSRICFNVGPSIALFPVNVSLDLFTQEEPSPSL